MADNKTFPSQKEGRFYLSEGGSETEVINHLLKYTQANKTAGLKTYKKGLRFDYDWRLNQP